MTKNTPFNYIEPIYDLTKFSEDELAQITPEALTSVRDFFENADLGKGVTLSLTDAKINGWHVSDYKATVVSRFTLNGEFHVATSDGHVVNVDAMINDMRGLLNR